MSVRGYWFAFAIGVTAGAAVALLYAPQTGDKVRKKLKSQIAQAGDYLDDAGGYLREKAGQFSSDAQSYINKGKQQVSTAADSAADLASAAAQKAKSLV